MPPRTTPLADPLPVRTRGALDIVLRPPGSRSLTNRALLTAALATGESLLTDITPSDDTRAMRDNLRALGVRIEKVEDASTESNANATGGGGAVETNANAARAGHDARARDGDNGARADSESNIGAGGAVESNAGATDAGGTETWRVVGSGGVLRAPSAHGARGFLGRLRQMFASRSRASAPGAVLDVGASGTTARFLAAAATLARGATTLDGSERMRARPIAELADALAQLGAPARVLGANGCPPLALTGGGLPGGRARISAARSSQFVSALLLVAPCAARDVTIELREGALVSRPFVDMTLAVMRAFGATPEWRAPSQKLGDDAQGAHALAAQKNSVTATPRTLFVPARGYRAARYDVAPDAQAAVYAFCAVAICGGRVRVRGLAADRVQGDLGVLDALAQMGCRVARAREHIEVRGPEGALRGVRADGNAWPDAVLALAVVTLFARGPSTLSGIAHLRLKESDRITALAAELTRLGASVRADDDALHITPGTPPASAVIQTYDDHRMAMSFALAGLRIPGVKIQNPGCVEKTWPDFFEELARW